MAMITTITERDGGLLITTTVNATIIPAQTIAGICRTLVNGRDIEDGLAPVEVVAAIIEEHIGEGEYKLDGPTDDDNWLVFTTDDGEPIYEAMGIEPTGLEIALSHLVMFGGSRDSVTVRKEA
jgi:hypothetical protein